VLRSARTLDAQDVQVCWDKPISQTSDVLTTANVGNDVFLIGYNAGTNTARPAGATLDQQNANCVDLAFNSHAGALDLGQFTAVEVEQASVTGATSGGQTGPADSVTLATSTTHNGTRGLSSAPDLTGPAASGTAIPPTPGSASSSTNTIDYVFDQTIDAAGINATGFWYENVNGQFCRSTNAKKTGPTTVTAAFSTTPGNGAGQNCADTVNGTTSSVNNARQAGVDSGSLQNVSDDPIQNADQGKNMPTAANGGATNVASLQSATLGPEPNQVTYHFDHPINQGAGTTVADFFIVLSPGGPQTSCGGCTGVVTGADNGGGSVSGGNSPNDLVVTFPGLQNFNEYAVQAGVTNGAAQGTNTGADAAGNTFTNTPGAQPIGGNAGAFARAFTTGPDAYAVSFDSAHDVATINFDQRVAGNIGGSTGGGHIRFLNADGNDVGGPTAITIPTTPNPGPVAVTMDVAASVMAQHPTQIALDPAATGGSGFCAFFTFYPNDNSDECSIPQVVSVTGSGAHIRAIKVAKRHHKAHRARRAHRRH